MVPDEWKIIVGKLNSFYPLNNGNSFVANHKAIFILSIIFANFEISERSPINMNNEIILYQPDASVSLEVRVEDETVWLNRNQIATLFDRDVKTIGKHINNALQEELAELPTVAKFAIVQKEGDRTVTRNVEHYNLDVISD